MTDAGLAHLRGLGRLESLDISSLQGTVTDAGLVHLRGPAQLRSLDLLNTKIQGPGLANLAELGRLERLSLPAVGDADMAHLAGLTSLETVTLGGDRLTDAGLAHLEGLTQLKAFYLSGISSRGITGAGLVHFKGMPHLETLALMASGVDDLAALRSLTGIKDLNLNGTRRSTTPAWRPSGASEGPGAALPATDSGRRRGARPPRRPRPWTCPSCFSNPLGALSHHRCGVTLTHLGALPKLDGLTLLGTNVTDAGLARLAGMSPLRFVNRRWAPRSTMPGGLVAALQNGALPGAVGSVLPGRAAPDPGVRHASMTRSKADLNLAISSRVPIVTRTCSGSDGQDRPTATLCLSIASTVCRPGPLPLTRTMLASEGM